MIFILLASCSSVDENQEEGLDIMENEAEVDDLGSEDSQDEEQDMSEEMSDSEKMNVDEISHYTVQDGDTWMLIAFKLYGDVLKWRSLSEFNDGQELASGSSVKYRALANEFHQEANGTAYLIRRGDTLGSISKDKYGTKIHWKALWKNNQVLIKNPDIIFAGFTMYYPAKEEIGSY